ncbi:MAG: hypothetical protein QM774_04140 [Gordonia sp. (in: high G+C Gram-positive bacteria)]|uniref:hypothetical protein n=1 Tax=Gordonia sp. (in: high G+C Gram-positive bacteria) TaxID=84139 RepID=UPI0039E2CB07
MTACAGAETGTPIAESTSSTAVSASSTPTVASSTPDRAPGLGRDLGELSLAGYWNDTAQTLDVATAGPVPGEQVALRCHVTVTVREHTNAVLVSAAMTDRGLADGADPATSPCRPVAGHLMNAQTWLDVPIGDRPVYDVSGRPAAASTLPVAADQHPHPAPEPAPPGSEVHKPSGPQTPISVDHSWRPLPLLAGEHPQPGSITRH